MKYFLRRVALIVLPSSVLAQSFTVTSLNPNRHATSVPPTAPISATFSQPLGAASAAAVRVFGQQSGQLTGQVTVTGAQLTMQAGRSFRAGEVISVTLPTGLQSSSGLPLRLPQVYQFRAQASAGTLRFAPAPNTTPAAGGNLVADVNGDGNLDLVGALSEWVSVRLGDGHGGFSGGSDIPAQVETPALGDFDGDGDPDLAIGPTRVLFNNGQGQFSGNTAASGQYAYALTTGDLDADGDLDMVASYGYSFNSSFVVMLNNGQGAFTAAGPATAMPYGSAEASLGDVDGDSDLDLVIGGHALYLNQGAATFTSAGEVLPGTNGTLSALADLDGDLDLDLLVRVGFSTVQVALNNGQGSFKPGVTLPLAGDPQRFDAPADLDGDGDLDLPISYRSGNSSPFTYQVGLWLNSGAATFTAGPGMPGLWAVPADFDNDGDLDVLSTNAQGVIRVLLQLNANQTTTLAVTARTPAANLPAVPRTSAVSATFSTPLASGPAASQGLRIFGSQRARSPVRATLNGNVLTLAPPLPYLPNERVAVSLTAGLTGTDNSRLAQGQVFEFTAAVGGGTGTFGPYSTLSGVASTSLIVPADFNGDGLLDLLTGSQLSLNQGSGRFAAPYSVAGNAGVSGLTVADFDADGDLDLALAITVSNGSGNSSKLVLYTNNGQAVFTAGRALPLGLYPATIVSGDLDGDGDRDVLAAGDFYGSAGIYLNDGEGRLQLISTGLKLPTTLGMLALHDVDGDGLLDLLVSTNSQVFVYKGLGTGEFQSNASSTIVVSGPGLSLADLDNDGDLDLLTTTSSQVSTRFNNGSGQFSGGSSFNIPSDGIYTVGLATGDLDGDGDLDIVAGGGELSSHIAVRYNDGTGNFSGTYSPVVAPGLTMPVAPALADLDGDGDLDLVVSRYNYSGMSMCFNGTGLLASTPSTVTSTYTLVPNPAQGAAQLLGAPAQTSVVVLDYLGREVSRVTTSATGTPTALPVAGLSSGIYTVRVGIQTLRLALE